MFLKHGCMFWAKSSCRNKLANGTLFMKQRLKQLLFGSYFRLAAFCVGLAVTPLILALVYNELDKYRQQTNFLFESSKETALGIAIQQHNVEASIVTMLQGISKTRQVTEQDFKECEELFFRLITVHAAINNIALYDASGHIMVWARHGGKDMLPLKQRATGIALETIISGDVIITSDKNESELLFILPLRNEAGGIERFITAAVELGYYARLIRDMQLPFKCDTALYDQHQQLLYVDKNPTLRHAVDFAGHNFPQHLPKDASGSLSIFSQDGNKYFACFVKQSYSSFTQPYLTTVMISDYDETFAPAYRAMLNSILWVALACLATLTVTVTACIVAFRRPLNRLLNISSKLGEGHFEARNELVGMGGAFSDYASVLYDMAQNLEKREDDLQAARLGAEAASKAKTEFLANMSHEIRTPMNAILGMAYLAQKSELNQVQLGYLSKVQIAGKSLLHIINDILDFSKMEAGKMEMETVRFAVRDLFTSISANYRRQMEEQEIKLHVDVAADVPMYLMGDPMRLEQAVSQLVDNAMRHTRQGTVRVNCSLVGIVRGDCTLRIVVADTGVGMRPDYLNVLNTALDSTDMGFRNWGDQGLGQGLGLPIAHRLFTMMDGSMHVTSELGRGTVFTCLAHFGYDEASQLRNTSLLADKRVLISDTAQATLAMHAGMLNNFSVQTKAIPKMQDALGELLAADAEGIGYDFFVFDWHNADMELHEIIQHIRNSMSLRKMPKIVVTSAFGRDEMRRLAEEAGADAFLHKPMHGSVLLDTLMNLCGAESSLAMQPEQITPYTVSLAGMRVLLVEDNLINQQLALELMDDAGLFPSVASNGYEALKLIAASQGGLEFDIILMDLQMPEMDGFEATWRIRKDTHLNAVYTPIIAMTAHRNSDEVEACRNSGMDDHVPKPIEVSVFFSALQRWMPIIPDVSGAVPDFLAQFEKMLEEKRTDAAARFVEWRGRLRQHIGEGRTAKIQTMLNARQFDNLTDFVRYLRQKTSAGDQHGTF